ncbi:hypothetical protein CAOG_09015 [Capsaspora owczarzaki ATCC 30864]|uniref:Peptidase M48 domain-containing protein n=1 Tax=Capsaspora owczarzaki (strain ATCC 30864) TaxID=595528 RepID=A0A0D2WW27_CAPO3|nr:hypothetical protein CAOG_09015 [Capsaspora owczarzaki ATCC 30864]KJE96598.1 hypothetical protein CAOG_009015 [Capsaspora owczarzaki ATCC 30864]|eukprot:XP_011270702.1 hypothetical protein CAOG_09015 [Capsaspora owczarzaki ATCC 30864]
MAAGPLPQFVMRATVLGACIGGTAFFGAPYLERQVEQALAAQVANDVPLHPAYLAQIHRIGTAMGMDMDRIKVVVANKPSMPASSGTRLNPRTSALLVLPRAFPERFNANAHEQDLAIAARMYESVVPAGSRKGDRVLVVPHNDFRESASKLQQYPPLTLAPQEQFVIAHELAHIRSEDTLKRWMSDSMMICMLVLLPLTLRRSYGVRLPLALGVGVASAPFAHMLSMAYGRRLELNADRDAAKAGYAAGGIRVMTALAEATDPILESHRTLFMLSDHPAPRTRLAELLKYAPKEHRAVSDGNLSSA